MHKHEPVGYSRTNEQRSTLYTIVIYSAVRKVDFEIITRVEHMCCHMCRIVEPHTTRIS